MSTEANPRFPYPALIVVGVAWNWFALALFYLTDSACPFLAAGVLLCTGPLIGILWLAASCYWPCRLFVGPKLAVWLSVPAAGALAVALATSDAGFRARVALSEKALARHVDRVAAAGAGDNNPHQVGLFHVYNTQFYNGGVYLFTSSSFINCHGVAHIPPGSKVAPRFWVRRLYGDWYGFEWKF